MAQKGGPLVGAVALPPEPLQARAERLQAEMAGVAQEQVAQALRATDEAAVALVEASMNPAVHEAMRDRLSRVANFLSAELASIEAQRLRAAQ